MHRKSKSCKGGRQRKEFLEREWSFIVEGEDVLVPEELQKENNELKETVRELEQQLSEKTDFIKRLNENKVTRGRKRSSEDYSDRQKRRIRAKRTKSCEISLSWLANEGYTPLQVIL